MKGCNTFASRFAIYGSTAFLAVLAAFAFTCHVFGSRLHTGLEGHRLRVRELRGFGGRDDGEEETIYAMECGDIYFNAMHTTAATSSVSPDDDDYNSRLCRYAQTCNGEFPSKTFLPLILCHGLTEHTQQYSHHRYTTESIFIYILLPPALLIWLALLFQLLATTADSYFSPALESFSFELGLPPRLAGATLLALGG